MGAHRTRTQTEPHFRKACDRLDLLTQIQLLAESSHLWPRSDHRSAGDDVAFEDPAGFGRKNTGALDQMEDEPVSAGSNATFENVVHAAFFQTAARLNPAG